MYFTTIQINWQNSESSHFHLSSVGQATPPARRFGFSVASSCPCPPRALVCWGWEREKREGRGGGEARPTAQTLLPPERPRPRPSAHCHRPAILPCRLCRHVCGDEPGVAKHIYAQTRFKPLPIFTALIHQCQQNHFTFNMEQEF